MFGLTPYRKNAGMRRYENDWMGFDRLMESFISDSLFPAFYTNSAQMKVDIKDADNAYVVEAELPGVDKQDIKLELVDNTLTISVNHEEQVSVEEGKDSYIRRERRQSSMARSFYVENVENDKVDAKFNNGILTITLPKKEQTTPESKNIEIN